jgi:hypothetical protein
MDIIYLLYIMESEKEESESSNTETTNTSTTNNEDSPLSQKESVVQSLEKRNLSPEQYDSSITLEFGDIIEIIAPTNPEIHEMSALITYIDNDKIKMVDVTNYNLYRISITEEGTLSDESIIQINLLSRSDVKGYARQNNLLPRTWIDIQFGGEIPAIITGEITNLEEDMIEITTFPELKTIYINFGYKGIPENIPIEKITIRNKPAIVTVPTLTMLQEGLEEGEVYQPGEDAASIEYTETGESIINIPKGAKAEKNVRDELHDMYVESSGIIFGERLEEIAQLVEIPEGNQRFGIDIQVNDLMDELLSNIPNSQRNKLVLDNIHLLIERYKELRSLYSKFDKNDNVYDVKTVGITHKPLLEHIEKMDKKLQWIVPVVANRRKLYDIDVSIDLTDVVTEKSSTSLRLIEQKQQDHKKDNKDPSIQYSAMYNRIQELMSPIEPPLNKDTYLHTTNVLTGLDSIIGNLEEFYSTVYKNHNLNRRQFVIQRYSLGLSKLEEQQLKTGKSIYIRKNMTPNDEITIKSLMMLPEPIIRFSSIELPSTSILEKANYHQNYFMLFRLLKKNLDIVPHVINDLSKELDYEKMEKDMKKAFFEGVHEFILSNDVIVDEEEKMNRFLDVIVPKKQYFIRLIRKYLKDKLSFVDVVQQLEPFMIYTSDITYREYMEIRHVMKERVSEVRNEIEKKSLNFSALRNAKYDVTEKPNPILRLLTEKKDFTEEFFKAYGLKSEDNNNNSSSAEILLNMIQSDNANLYTNTITSILISLMTPNQLLDVLAEPNLDDITDMEKIKPIDCARKYLAKRYSTIRDMQKDNEEDEVYFDTDLDDTPYEIIRRYKKEKASMIPELFVEFLERTIIDKHDCPRNIAPELAKTLITGKKLIMDGDYAVLELKPELPKDVDQEKLTEKEKKDIAIEADARKKIQYYRRLKGTWVKDKDIDEEAFLDTNTIFCNVSQKCYKNPANNVCEPIDESYERMKEISKKKMLNEFDKRYSVNVEELEKELEGKIQHDLKMMKKMHVLSDIKLFKQSRLAFALGNMAEVTDLIVSPNMKLRDLILGQEDFVKKQYDICRFIETYCREPMVDNLDESPHWLYCKETNTKLFPFSLYELAKTFISGGDYARKLDEICHTVGVLSDDGDSEVDKHSGFVLRKREHSTEEGFDTAGYHITTHDIMEKDLGIVAMEIMQSKEKRVFENEIAEIIYNVSSTICRNIDIPMDSIETLILTMSREIFDRAIFTESKYQKLSDKNLKDKGKALKPYRDYRDETRMVVIASCLFVAIQTATPSFKTTKSFPGCVRSFSGYPLSGGVEDMTGLQYMACVLDKSKNKEAHPWAAISSLKPDVIVKRMKDILEKYIVERSDVNDLYVKKREFMMLNPDLVAPEEHNITKWTTFLPPVVDFSVLKTIHNVASDFESELKEDMRKGSARQEEGIHVIKSKLAQYGFGIIESINNIVKTKDLILKNSAKIPFLENACCNDKLGVTNPVLYFNEEDPHISQFIISSEKLSKLSKFTRESVTPAFLYHPTFTGIRFSAVSANNLDDVELIYSSIIHYCNFDKNRPIPEKFKPICNEKPAKYNPSWTIYEKIEFLKSNANQYNVDHLLQLMSIVNNENLVTVDKPVPFSKIDVMRELIEHLDSSESTIIDEPLRRLLLKLLATYKPKCMSYEVSNELNALKNHLILMNRDLYKQIIDFFGRYGNLTDLKYQQLHSFLTNIEKWKTDVPMKENGLYYDSGLYSVTQFINNSVQALCKIYPSILLNDVGFYKKVPKHWNFSDKHNVIISKFVEQYYEKIEKFKGDGVLLRLLQEISGGRLTDLPLFLQNIPFYTEIVKDMGDEVEGERVRSFHCLFDKPCIYLLHTYCFYSSIYEYIVLANDADLLRSDVQTVKQKHREQIRDRSNKSNQLTGLEKSLTEELNDVDMDFNEVEIVTGDLEELKKRVASLLLCFLNLEEENKDAIDYTYEQIMQKVKRDKDIEKKGIIERLGNMSIEERKVENELKNYRIGRWNVGEQKGLYQYDKKTFDREIDEMLAQGEELEIEDNVELLDADQVNVVDPGEDPENIYERGAVDFGELGENFTDGAYYEEDRDYEDEW